MSHSLCASAYRAYRQVDVGGCQFFKNFVSFCRPVWAFSGVFGLYPPHKVWGCRDLPSEK